MSHNTMDRTTAWPAFRSRLASFLTGLRPGQFLIIRAVHPDKSGIGGVEPYVQVCRDHRGHLHAEVASNAFLAVEHRLTLDQETALITAGWALPNPGPGADRNYTADTANPRAVAALVTTTLVDILEIARPEWLAIASVGSFADGVPSPDPSGLLPDPAAASPTASSTAVVYRPVGPDDLRGIVADLLPSLAGLADPIDPDDDGDFVLDLGGIMVVLHIDDESPLVHVYAVLACNVAATEHLLFLLNDLNGAARGATLHIGRGHLFLSQVVRADPLCPDHLYEALDLLRTNAGAMAAAIADYFGAGDDGAGPSWRCH